MGWCLFILLKLSRYYIPVLIWVWIWILAFQGIFTLYSMTHIFINFDLYYLYMTLTQGHIAVQVNVTLHIHYVKVVPSVSNSGIKYYFTHCNVFNLQYATTRLLCDDASYSTHNLGFDNIIIFCCININSIFSI